MGFESLQISEPLKKALSSSVNSGRFPHAAILEDEDSERLMDTAKTLAAALVCSGEGKPCGRCINCLKALSDSHPDIKIFEPDPKTDNFRIETVRELRPDASCKAAMAEAAVTPDETCPFVTSVLPVVHLSSSILLFKTCTQIPGSILTCTCCKESCPRFPSTCTNGFVQSAYSCSLTDPSERRNHLGVAAMIVFFTIA